MEDLPILDRKAYLKAYYQKNKERIKERERLRGEDLHKDRCREYGKKNRELIQLRRKLRKEGRFAELAELKAQSRPVTFVKKDYEKGYYQENKGRIKNQANTYKEANRANINEKQAARYHANKDAVRRKSQLIADSGFCRTHTGTKAVIKGRCEHCALKGRLSSGLRDALKKRNVRKDNKTIKVLGCSLKQFHDHIQAQFLDGMTWENIKEWHLDHIIPIASAQTTEQVFSLYHFTNLRPLWAVDNIKKSSWHNGFRHCKKASGAK